jgi:NADPH2:quinone reductase
MDADAHVQAATIPLAAMTAAIGLFMQLRLPEPWHATTVPTPLIVYGASGAVGSYAIKLAQASNIHPIIAVAGKGQEHVEKLITRSKGDTIVDYRKGNEAVVAGLREALQKAGLKEVRYAFDTVSEKNSYQNICEVLAPGGKITLVLPGKEYKEIPANIEQSLTQVGGAHWAVPKDSPEGKAGVVTGSREFAYVFFRIFSKGLQDGWFTPHPHEVIPGGLSGVSEGLTRLKDGKASAVKYVYRIAE